MSDAACSCGRVETHDVGTRETFDGGRIVLRSDGSLWLADSRPVLILRRLPGRSLSGGWSMLDRACLLDAGEVPAAWSGDW